MTPDPLPPDLACFRNSYADLFGQVLPLSDAKFAFNSSASISLSRAGQDLAFYWDKFYAKTRQFLLLEMLMTGVLKLLHTTLRWPIKRVLPEKRCRR